MTETIRILVADDHPVVREGLVMILETQPDFLVVGEAENGGDAVRMTAQLQPDVILLDLEMPELDGVEAMQQLQNICPEVSVLVFTAFDTDDRIVGAVQAGAKGYLLKGAPRDEIFKAIRVLKEGGTLLQPVVVSKLMQHVRADREDQPVETLTDREMEVLRLLGRGSTNREIGTALVITERTVKFHISSILGKLGAGNRTEAVTLAVQKGLISLDT